MRRSTESSLRIVPDTNVLIGGLLFFGDCWKIMLCHRSEILKFVISKAIINELECVLERLEKKGKLIRNWYDVNLLKSDIIETSETIDPDHHPVPKLKHKKDEIITDVGITAKVDYIVTRDEKHLIPLKEVYGIPIICPRRLLEIIKNQERE